MITAAPRTTRVGLVPALLLAAGMSLGFVGGQMAPDLVGAIWTAPAIHVTESVAGGPLAPVDDYGIRHIQAVPLAPADDYGVRHVAP